MGNETTVELSRRAKEGDAEAFGALYSLVWHDLYRYACYFLGNRQDAEDVVQETAAEAFHGIGTLRDPEAFKRWIFAILIRRCKRALRQTVRARSQISLEDSLDLPAERSGDLEQALELEEQLLHLSADERTVILLSATQGYSAVEIGRMLGCPAGTVRSRLSRAYAKLRDEMKDHTV